MAKYLSEAGFAFYDGKMKERLAKKLDAAGDGSQATVSFNPAAGRDAPASGETLAVLMGKLAGIISDFVCCRLCDVTDIHASMYKNC